VPKYIMFSLMSLYTFMRLVFVSRRLFALLMFYSCFRVSRTILTRVNHIRVVPEEIEEEMKFVHVPNTEDARNIAHLSHLCWPCAARTEAAHGPNLGLCGHCVARIVAAHLWQRGVRPCVRPHSWPHTLDRTVCGHVCGPHSGHTPSAYIWFLVMVLGEISCSVASQPISTHPKAIFTILEIHSARIEGKKKGSTLGKLSRDSTARIRRVFIVTF